MFAIAVLTTLIGAGLLIAIIRNRWDSNRRNTGPSLFDSNHDNR